jgi:hypothetical protein
MTRFDQQFSTKNSSFDERQKSEVRKPKMTLRPDPIDSVCPNPLDANEHRLIVGQQRFNMLARNMLTGTCVNCGNDWCTWWRLVEIGDGNVVSKQRSLTQLWGVKDFASNIIGIMISSFLWSSIKNQTQNLTLFSVWVDLSHNNWSIGTRDENSKHIRTSERTNVAMTYFWETDEEKTQTRRTNECTRPNIQSRCRSHELLGETNLKKRNLSDLSKDDLERA